MLRLPLRIVDGMTTSSPASTGTARSFSAVDAITTAHLVMIAVLAVIVVIAMFYGAHLKHRRTLAQREEQLRLDGYENAHPDAAPTQASPRRPAAPSQPVTTSSGQEEQRPPVAAAPVAPRDAADQRLPPAAAATPSRPAVPRTDGAPGDAPGTGPLTQLKGLGPKVAARLAELGITSIGQIAALDDDAAGALDARLGAFQGRIGRDRWVEQARFLAAGDRAGFEAVFGRL